MERLLCICPDFPPQVNPTSIRTAKLLRRLANEFQITVVTATPGAALDGVDVRCVPAGRGIGLLRALRRIRLEKVADMLAWPDESRSWVAPALREAGRIIEAEQPAAVVVFMMPYAAGLVGLALKRRYDIPLILNLDDSPTCSDMHDYPTRLHYEITRRLEDRFCRESDAMVYVSGLNLRRVRDRQPEPQRKKFTLVRYGADPADFAGPPPAPIDDVFRIAYIGGMTGWTQFYHGAERQSLPRRLYRKWLELGRYRLTQLDQRSSSPYFIAKAVKSLASSQPQWDGRVAVCVYGNKYPQMIVDRALANGGIADVVHVYGTVPNAKAIAIARSADLLFLALPDRPDGTPGGRISAKTYEYLMTDRPVLAAVPPGENRNFLTGRPGVFLVDPSDVVAMANVIEQMAAQKFAGSSVRYDRRALSDELSYDGRAHHFAQVIRRVITARPADAGAMSAEPATAS